MEDRMMMDARGINSFLVDENNEIIHKAILFS